MEKIHHCFNCGEETEDYEYLPNDVKVWICHSPACGKELRDTAREVQSEMRSRAEEDDFMRYSY